MHSLIRQRLSNQHASDLWELSGCIWLVAAVLDSKALQDGTANGWKPRALLRNLQVLSLRAEVVVFTALPQNCSPKAICTLVSKCDEWVNEYRGIGERWLLNVRTNIVIVKLFRIECKDWGKLESHIRDFPGGPLIKTPRFHCREPGFNPWSAN